MEVQIVVSIIVWALTGVLGALASFFAIRYKTVSKENKALKNGMQSLLRSDIIKSHDKYMDRGYAPIYAKESLTKSYESYHDLGGNGVVTKLYKDVIALPEEQKEKMD